MLLVCRRFYVFCAFFWFSLPLPATEFTHPMTTITTSQNDKNSYRAIRLNNDLRVILVSDPLAEKASAAMAINVGSHQDPNTQLGLTHFLEHMLFLGTQKYPDAADYQNFIRKHGGSHNAYTSHDNTNYFFDIQTEAFDAALDRFAAFFIQPLFSEHFTEREKQAVHSEYLAKIQDENRRANQAFKQLLNPAHPQSRFSVGSLETLKDNETGSLQKQLILLFEQYYYANNMSLVLVANLDLSVLEQLATTYFSAIPAQPRQIKPIKAAVPLTLDTSPTLQFMQPLNETYSLSFSFVIPSQHTHYERQPVRYISYILGHEAEGSLYAYLKQQGWVNAISASDGYRLGEQQLFRLHLQLTPNGLSHWDEITQAVFATINLLKSQPINPQFLQEALQLSQFAFDYQDYLPPITLSRILASQHLTVPTRDVLSAFKITQYASPESIQLLLNQFTPNKALIQIISPSKWPTHWTQEDLDWKTEPWYNSLYSNHTLKDEYLAQFTQARTSETISLPATNPFIPKDLTLIDEFDPQPVPIMQKPEITFWHRSDNRFTKPTGYNYLAVRFTHAADNDKNQLLNRLLTRLFNDAMTEKTYLAYVAGLSYSVYPHLNGMTINTGGYADKQQPFMMWLLNSLLEFQPSEPRFELIKQQLQQDLDNQLNSAPYQLAMAALTERVTQDSLSLDTMRTILPQIQFKDVIHYKQLALSSFNLVGFSNGNVSRQQSLDFATQLYQQHRSQLVHYDSREAKAVDFSPHTHIASRFLSHHDDTSVLYVIRNRRHPDGETTYAAQARYAITNQLLSAAFYHQLRTQQQFGYIVSSHNFLLQDVPMLGFTIQSPSHSVRDMTDAIERFIETETTSLLSIDESTFNQAQQAILLNLRRTPKSLREITRLEWQEIAQNPPDFERKQHLIEAVERLTATDLIHFIQQTLLNEDATHRLLFHNKNNETPLSNRSWTTLTATDQLLQ